MTTRTRIQQERRLLGRALPICMFMLLFWIDLKGFVDAVSAASHPSALRILGRALYLVFILLYIVFTLMRGEATAIDRRVVPRVATVVGTFGLVITPVFYRSHGPVLFNLGSAGGLVETALAFVSIVGALVTLSVLGRSFSLSPQAHSLVATGPYRLIRHPLYFFEGVAMLGGVIASGRLDGVLITAVVLGAQVVRMGYEEALLRRSFADYDEKFAGVAHLIPGVW